MTQRAKPERWTTRRLLSWTEEYFSRKGLDAPRISAEMLLAHVLNLPRIKLYMDLDRPATPLELAAYRELVERAVADEPVQYLVGWTSFFSLKLSVNRSTLIPQPSTETLVEHVLQHSRRTPGFRTPRVADIGTGSGAIAIAVAKNIPGARVVATDISAEALELARTNATTHGVADRIEFREGDLYEPLGVERFEYLLSNPPYIPDSEWHDPKMMGRDVKGHVPERALRGGVDGLKYLKPMIEQAHRHLEKPGQLVFEIAASTRSAVLALAESHDYLTNPHILADFDRLPRVLVADRL